MQDFSHDEAHWAWNTLWHVCNVWDHKHSCWIQTHLYTIWEIPQSSKSSVSGVCSSVNDFNHVADSEAFFMSDTPVWTVFSTSTWTQVYRYDSVWQCATCLQHLIQYCYQISVLSISCRIAHWQVSSKRVMEMNFTMLRSPIYMTDSLSSLIKSWCAHWLYCALVRPLITSIILARVLKRTKECDLYVMNTHFSILGMF